MLEIYGKVKVKGVNDMVKMNCMMCKHFEFCRNHHYTIEVTTSDEFNKGQRVFVFGLDVEPPAFCPYDMGRDKYGELRGMKNERIH